MKPDWDSFLERTVLDGFKEALAELEEDDTSSAKEENALNGLEKRLKKRKENSSSHKRLEEIRKLTRNK